MLLAACRLPRTSLPLVDERHTREVALPRGECPLGAHHEGHERRRRSRPVAPNRDQPVLGTEPSDRVRRGELLIGRRLLDLHLPYAEGASNRPRDFRESALYDPGYQRRFRGRT